MEDAGGGKGRAAIHWLAAEGGRGGERTENFPVATGLPVGLGQLCGDPPGQHVLWKPQQQLRAGQLVGRHVLTERFSPLLEPESEVMAGVRWNR